MAAEHTALVGARIKQAREEAGLTQNELADALPGKADGTQVSKWERAVHRPGDDTLKRIADITKHDLAWFHTREPDKSSTPDLSLNDASQMDRIERKLDELLKRIPAEQTDTSLEIHRAFEDLASRLGREVGKRPPRSQPSTGRSRATPPAAA